MDQIRNGDDLRTHAGRRGRLAIAAAWHRIRNDERGMSTAEYAVGTVAAVGLGGLLVKILSSEEMRQLLWSIISGLLGTFLG